MNQTIQLRRVASHQFMLPNGQLLEMMVVVIRSGYVEEYHPLQGEEPQTEWLSGLIRLKPDTNGQLKAYYQERVLE